MAETPTPQKTADVDIDMDVDVDVEMNAEVDDAAATQELRRPSSSPSSSRPRRRSVSAFAPVPGSKAPAAGVVSQEQKDFVEALRRSDVIDELKGSELERSAAHVRGVNRAARCIDLLQAYYTAAENPLNAERRRATDRWFLHDSSAGDGARMVVERLQAAAPEIGEVQMVRIGSTHGALVLRCGEHVCALEDEPDASGGNSVTVQDIVRAFNVLLDRHQVRARLVALTGDGRREAYVGLASMGAAMGLMEAGYLAADDAEGLMDQAAW